MCTVRTRSIGIVFVLEIGTHVISGRRHIDTMPLVQISRDKLPQKLQELRFPYFQNKFCVLDCRFNLCAISYDRWIGGETFDSLTVELGDAFDIEIKKGLTKSVSLVEYTFPCQSTLKDL